MRLHFLQETPLHWDSQMPEKLSLLKPLRLQNCYFHFLINHNVKDTNFEKKTCPEKDL